MGKISSLVQAEQERKKGNIQAAEAIQKELADKTVDITIREEQDLERAEIESQTIPKGSEVELPVKVAPDLAPLNRPDEDAANQASQVLTGRGLPSESEQMQAEMRAKAAAGPLPAGESVADPYFERIKNVANYDVEGNLLPASRLNAQMNAQRQMALGLEQVPQSIDYGFETGADLLKQVQNGKQGLDAYNTVSDKGLAIQAALNTELQVPLITQTPEGQAFYEVATNAGLIDPNTQQFTRRFGNAVSIQLIEAFTKEQQIKDKTIKEGGEISLIPLTELNFDADPYEDMEEVIDPLAQGQLLNPEARRTALFNGIVDKIMPNPNQDVTSGAVSGFGGASTSLTPETKAYGDALIWQALSGMGFVDQQTVDGKDYYVMSKAAEDYYLGTRALINDINPNQMILPTLSPNVESTNISAVNFLGFNKVGNVSIKSQRSLNDTIQMAVVDMIGKMNNRILPSALAVHAHQVNSVINYKLTADNKIMLDKRDPLKGMVGKSDPVQVRNRNPDTMEQMPTVAAQYPQFYSTHPLAKAIGLGKDKWTKAYNNAINVYGKSEADAQDQADAVMRSQARQIAMNFEMAKRFSNSTFYLQGFYANTNGRYHYRQTVLNPQNLKPNRALLAAAKREIVDLNKTDLSSSLMQGWMYNIGRAILPVSELGLAKTDNMGFNQVLNPTQKILSEGVKNPIYLEWIRKGKLLNQITKSNSAFPGLYNANVDEVAQIIEAIADPEEWGPTTTAYIDVYNYHVAKSNKEKSSDRFPQFPNATISRSEYIVPYGKDNQRVAALEQQLSDAKESGDPDIIAQVESDIFKELETLKVPVETNQSTKFELTVIAKPDGKQSGPTIQSLQNGDVKIAGLTGFIYSSQDNVIPEGDIRSLFFDKFVLNSQSLFNSDVDKQEFWTNVSKMMSQSNDQPGLIKELARTPLMEYTYGKFALFNQAHVLNFLRTPFGKRIMQAAEDSGISGYAPTPNDPAGYRDLVSDFNNLIGNSLTQTMDVKHQGFLKNLGLAWAMMGGETGRFTGPLGDTVYLGTRMRVKTGKSISIPFERGRLGIDLTKSITTGSARPEKRNRGFDDITLKFTIADPLDHGKMLANQMGVLPVQNLDAALMANSIYRVNKDRRDNPVWGLFIHDSIIANAAGIKAYMRAYNDSMAKLALPGSPNYWQISKSTEEAYIKGLSEWRKRIMNRKEDIKISGDDTNRYAAMYDYLKRIDGFENPNIKVKDLKRKVQSLGWNFDLPVQYLAPARVYNLYLAITEFMNLKGDFKDWRERQAKATPILMKKIAKETLNMG